MHDWSDKNVDWRGIDAAAHFIGRGLRRWGRMNVSDMKEKWGTVRVYCVFGWNQMHCITHPGFHYNQYPWWLWRFDCQYLSKIIPPLTNWFVVPYQKMLYRWYYTRAVRKWPHLAREILSAADHSERLRTEFLTQARILAYEASKHDEQ